MNKRIPALAAAAALALSLAACGSGDDSTNDEATSSTGSDSAAEATTSNNADTVGINEIPVGDSGPQTNDALTVDAVYFQAIEMEQGSSLVPPASDSDMHFEVDISTNEKATEWGYEADQFLPYLDVTAVATDTDSGEDVDLGTMMPMIASDGPHYGNNISLEPGNYSVTITVKSPADDFMLHTGNDSSAVSGRFWDEPLTFEFDNWQWDGQLI